MFRHLHPPPPERAAPKQAKISLELGKTIKTETILELGEHLKAETILELGE